MSEFWGVISLEIRKFSEESRDLSDNPKEIIRGRMIMHLESFNSLIVFYDRIERSFLKFLPISTKIIFGVWIEKQQEIFNV